VAVKLTLPSSGYTIVRKNPALRAEKPAAHNENAILRDFFASKAAEPSTWSKKVEK
jgi:hypothetical protein